MADVKIGVDAEEQHVDFQLSSNLPIPATTNDKIESEGQISRVRSPPGEANQPKLLKRNSTIHPQIEIDEEDEKSISTSDSEVDTRQELQSSEHKTKNDKSENSRYCKYDIVWTQIDGHFVECVVQDVMDDPKSEGKKLVMLRGKSGYVPEREISSTQPTKYDIGYITSAPLVYETGNSLVPMEELDLEKDEKIFERCLHESGKELNAVKCIASIKNLFSICNRGCAVLHYSGHGVGGSLAFENHKESEIGGTHLITHSFLKKVLSSKAGKIGVKLAVVSACHSEKAGYAFVNAGVPHVVAIKNDHAVHDDAAMNFTEQFYTWLFTGNSVATAYRTALTAVESETNASRYDGEVYLLLPQGKQYKHQDVLFPNQKDGVHHFSQLQDIAQTNLPMKPSQFIGRAIFQRNVIRSVLANRCVLVFGPPGEGKGELVKMAARYIHERSLDQFAGGVVWVDLKEFHRNVRVKSGPVPKFTLFNAIRSIIDEMFGGLLLRKTSSNGSVNTAFSEEGKFFGRMPSKMLLVLRGLECLTDKNHCQKTEETLRDLLASPASPHLLMTHQNDLQSISIPMERHRVPHLSKDDSSKIFKTIARRFVSADLKRRLFPPNRWQLRWWCSDGEYYSLYYSARDDVFAEYEAKRKEGIQARVIDLAPNGVHCRFEDIPQLQGEHEKKEVNETKLPMRKDDSHLKVERRGDFLDWLTSNPKRIIQVAKFAKLYDLSKTWDVMSKFTYSERQKTLSMICRLELSHDRSLDNGQIKKLFDQEWLVNKNRRMKWKELKNLLDIRFRRSVTVTLRENEQKYFELSSFDWDVLERTVLRGCTNANDLSMSEKGFIIWMRQFIELEKIIMRSLKSFSTPEFDRLPAQVLMIAFFEVFLINNTSKVTVKKWNDCILCDRSKRMSLFVIQHILPLCFWKLLPNSTRWLELSEINWIKDMVIKKNFITHRELESMSFNGWRFFYQKVLEPWCNIIRKEINMWNSGVFVGFCSEDNCRNWLSDHSNGTFVVRFLLSCMDEQKRTNAIIFSHVKNNSIINSRVEFDFSDTTEKPWKVSHENFTSTMSSLTEVMEALQLLRGLDPYNKKIYARKDLICERSAFFKIYHSSSGIV